MAIEVKADIVTPSCHDDTLRLAGLCVNDSILVELIFEVVGGVVGEDDASQKTQTKCPTRGAKRPETTAWVVDTVKKVETDKYINRP